MMNSYTKPFVILVHVTKSTRKSRDLIDWAAKDHISALCECIFNVIIGNIWIPAHLKKELKKSQNLLRTVTSKDISLCNRKTLLKRKLRLVKRMLTYSLKSLK